jgi:hypothetical protein
MNAVVAFHPSLSVEAEIAGKLIGTYPENVHYYHLPIAQTMVVCLKEKDDKMSAEPTLETLRATAAHITLDMLK